MWTCTRIVARGVKVCNSGNEVGFPLFLFRYLFLFSALGKSEEEEEEEEERERESRKEILDRSNRVDTACADELSESLR